MQSVLLNFIIGALISLAADIDSFSIKPKPLTVIGTCPSKDGEYPTYLPDSEDCSVFYECSAGEPNLKKCMEGLCFDTSLNVCAFPPQKDDKQTNFVTVPFEAVGTCPPRDTNETIFLVDDSDCRTYYVCSNGEAIANVCLPGQAWNSDLNTCDWEINVECDKRSLGIKKAPKTAVGECPSKDPGMPIYLPDSSDCSNYYECSNGEAILNTCPPDMLWNTHLNTCDWPINVFCDTPQS